MIITRTCNILNSNAPIHVLLNSRKVRLATKIILELEDSSFWQNFPLFET